MAALAHNRLLLSLDRLCGLGFGTPGQRRVSWSYFATSWRWLLVLLLHHGFCAQGEGGQQFDKDGCCGLVLILSQSYTASLASLLTVQQFQPAVNELDDLIRNRENVGYEQGSYVKAILAGLGFEESKLIMFKSTKELHGLFQNGGVAAAFESAPKMKLFMAQYCNKYTIVEPGFQNDGFGFVFPKGSPLVSDISKAILEVKEGGRMDQIEEQWFAKEKNCPDSSTSITSTSLDVNSFLGLFIIAGVVSCLALVLSVALFVRDNKRDLEPSSELENSTRWSKVQKALKIYSGKDWIGSPSRPTTIHKTVHVSRMVAARAHLVHPLYRSSSTSWTGM